MTTVTTQSRLDLIGLFIGCFNAAPGAVHLGSLASLLGAGRSLTQIASVLAARPEFASVYSPDLSNDEFVAALAANLLGTEAGSRTTAWATSWAKTMLDAGTARQDVIVAALRALKTTPHPDFVDAKHMLLNKVDVAAYYSMSLQGSATSLAELQKVIKNVSSNVPMLVQQKALLTSGLLDFFTPTFALTDGVDTVVGGQGNDTIAAFLSGSLSAGDAIDGAGGLDELYVHKIDSISLPTSLSVKQVETAHFTAYRGFSGDLSAWDGLLTLNVRSVAGDVSVTAAATTDVAIVLQGDSTSITNAVVDITVDVRGGDTITITSDAGVLPTIVNPHVGITLGFGPHKPVALATQPVSAPANANFQPLLDLAAAGDGTATTQLAWFVYEGNTFVVADNSASVAYVSGTDAIIKLVGIIEVGVATVNTSAGKSVSFTLI